MNSELNKYSQLWLECILIWTTVAAAL